MEAVVRPAKRLKGTLTVPGDKSISHRALMLGALAQGTSVVRGLAPGRDVRSTARCLRALGVPVALANDNSDHDVAVVEGRGLYGLRAPQGPLDAGNSGTTLRLLAGILAGQPFASVLTGDASLRRRPMARIAEPLRRMGALIDYLEGEGRAPLRVRGPSEGRLRAIEHEPPVPSAQVKSCVLLAGLYAEGVTVVRESSPTRDHTERLLARLGAPLELDGLGLEYGRGVRLRGPVERLEPFELRVPGDPSSAAFFVAAAALLPGSELLLRHVGVNPTRTGFLDALRRMGAPIELLDEREVGGEPVADVLVRGAPALRGLELDGAEVPRLIDELPLLAVVATRAEGVTVIRGAKELRVKETDRIRAVALNLRRLGARVEERPDGFVIEGPQALRGGRVEGFGDHRVVMAFAVAGLVARGETTIEGAEWADVSYPQFFEALERVVER